MAGLVPAIHVLLAGFQGRKTWMLGMTNEMASSFG
jgi:hypothetical protein